MKSVSLLLVLCVLAIPSLVMCVSPAATREKEIMLLQGGTAAGNIVTEVNKADSGQIERSPENQQTTSCCNGIPEFPGRMSCQNIVLEGVCNKRQQCIWDCGDVPPPVTPSPSIDCIPNSCVGTHPRCAFIGSKNICNIKKPMCEWFSVCPGGTTDAPTELPEIPTVLPTNIPTDTPTQMPTDTPTRTPTDAPTDLPTNAPTDTPTEAPTQVPTDAPTDLPTDTPTEAPPPGSIIVDSEVKIRNPTPDGYFGSSSSLLDGILVVGAFFEDTDAVMLAGMVYTYLKDSESENGWTELQQIESSTPNFYGLFGDTVLMSEEYPDILFVTSEGDTNHNGDEAGAVFVFQRNAETKLFSEVTKLTANDGSEFDAFGGSISLHGSTLAVGAYLTDTYRGAVYLFEERSDGSGIEWEQTRKLTADDADADNVSGELFGTSVCITSELLAVGAWGDDDLSEHSGSVYLFEKVSGSDWTQTTKLLPNDEETSSEGHFGDSLSISDDGETLAVAASRDSLKGYEAGTVYIFTKQSGEWSLAQQLYGTDTDSSDLFGVALVFSGTQLLVGATAADSDGAVYQFRRETEWQQTDIIVGSDRQYDDMFGGSIFMNGEYMIVGAPGVFSDTGAIYIYDVQ